MCTTKINKKIFKLNKQWYYHFFKYFLFPICIVWLVYICIHITVTTAWAFFLLGLSDNYQYFQTSLAMITSEYSINLVDFNVGGDSDQIAKGIGTVVLFISWLLV